MIRGVDWFYVSASLGVRYVMNASGIAVYISTRMYKLDVKS
jgi:hypothetical protein